MIFASIRSLLLTAVALGGLIGQTPAPAPAKSADAKPADAKPAAIKLADVKPPQPAKAPEPAPPLVPEPSGVSSPAEVQSIYLLPMGSGLDQYLATQIVRHGFYRVVTDPSKADAILTDRIGRSFEMKIDELYPKPAPPPPPPEVKPSDDSKQSKDDEEAAKAEVSRRQTEAAMDKARTEWMASRSSFGRGHGTLYLVDRYNRNVLWSIYQPPKNSRSDELDRTAQRIVEELEKKVKPRK